MAQHTASRLDETIANPIQCLNDHLVAALQLADALALPPQLGARIQEVLDLVEDCLSTSKQ